MPVNRMRIRLLATIIVLVLLQCVFEGGKVIAGPIPPEVKSVVVFIFMEREGKLIPNGTAFLVGVKNPSAPTTFSVYLVTA
jgi:hypothetical protein